MVLATALRRPPRAAWRASLIALLVLLAGAVVVLPSSPAQAAQDPVSCASSVGLVNGDFEQPRLPDRAFAQLDQSAVPGWRTTSPDGLIEIWRTGFRGVTAGAGAQFAELNATQFSNLYQDQPTVPGTVLRWSLLHRGRDGTDKMAVSIGPASGPLVKQKEMSDNRSTWGAYSGFYTVPPGQTTTRFSFEAVNTAGGVISVGNFLDDITFGTSACVVVDQTVSSPTGTPYAQGGDVLTLTVNATSGGGNSASDSTVRSIIPAGVTFVPGSIRVISGGVTTSPSDGTGDDTAEYDPRTRQVVVRVGSGATASGGGVLRLGDASTVTYQVRVDPTSSPSTFGSDSTLTYFDPLSSTTRTATTNSVGLVLNPVADLAVTLARTSALPVVAGSPVTWTATLSNNGSPSVIAGQDSAYGTTLTTRLPATLSGLTGTTPGGTCTAAGGVLTCALGVLPKREERTVTLTGIVSPDAPPVPGGLVLQVTAGTLSRDLDQGNDTASATDDVTAVADVGVALTATPATPAAGTDITYRAVLTNRGPSTARTVVLTAPLPAGTSDPRASVPGGTCSVPDAATGAVQCSLPSLAPGVTATVTILVRTAPDRLGTVTSTVTASAETPDPSSADNTATATTTTTTAADVKAVLTVPAGSVRLGGSTPYELTVSNRGPSTAVATKVTFTAPPGLTVGRPTSPFCSASGCTIPTLAPGTSVVLRGTLTAAATTPPGKATLTATAAATTSEVAPADNTATTVVLVGAPSLELSVLGAVTESRRVRGAAAGDHVVWTYVVTNTGDVAATGLTVVLPGTTATVQTTACQLGTLPVGATAACHAVATRTVTDDDVSRLAVTTTVEVTASWVGGTALRSPPATGSLATALPGAAGLRASPALLLPSGAAAAPAAAPAGP